MKGRRFFLTICVFALAFNIPAAFGDLDASVDMTHMPKVDNAMSGSVPSGTDAASARGVRAGGQEYAFQAEVSRLMDILINSLYSNKDVFLREIISNAADALDKIRFLSLTDKSMLGEGETSKLEIKISLDKEKRILLIRDRGVGMTKDELIKNLGTIAKSGTSAFLENMQKGGDVNLIGQFGVGFYSVYLVADYVEVVSKNNDDDKQYIWSSTADGSFSISEDTENEPLGRGTLIKLHLKEEAQEYAQEAKLKELVTKYSEFTNFPIYLLTEKEVDVPIEDAETKDEEADVAAAGEDDSEEDGVDDESEEEGADEEKAPATRKEKRPDWELLNDNKAIWLRKPSEVTEEEYTKFYKAVSKDYAEPLTHVHFRAEGDVEFRSILYIPKNSPYEFYDKYYEKSQHGLKLYVRRVFISDDMTELIPRYLSFVRGIVDSDSLPLNVSREMLQQEAALKTIKKKIVRKVLDLIRKMADNEKKCKDADEAGDEEAERPGPEECSAYGAFWGQFGRALKLGIIEDTTNRVRLAKLLRFHSSRSGDQLRTLDEYVAGMKEGQKSIYWVAGSSKEDVAASPFVEVLLRKGYEVIYFTDVLDEYVMGHLLEFDDKKFANASKEDLKLSDKDEKEVKKDKAAKEAFRELTKWWTKTLGDKVTAVKVSKRLTTTPVVVVTDKYGQSANMERIMKAQAFQDPSKAAMSRSKKALEINPRHPLIVALRERVAADPDDATTAVLATIIFETALLEGGFTPDDPKSFSKRLYSVVGEKLGTTSMEVQEEEEQAESADAVEENDDVSIVDTDEEPQMPPDFDIESFMKTHKEGKDEL
ncbi:MAG: hypothetical protein WDW36_000986 [Sanguina aurantia]